MYSIADKETIKETIVNQVRNGKSLNELCTTNKLPDRDTLHRWLNKDKEFYDNYIRAKEEHFIKEGYELMAIADNAGETREEISKAALRVDTRKWLLSKLLPKTFGSQNQTNIQINNNIDPVRGMSIVDEEEDIKEID